MPATQRSAKTRLALVRISIVNSTLWAITGIITFSSSCPASAAVATVTSFPIAWKQTMFTISAIDGFTLPGMMLEPGCTGGSKISAMPVRGPEASRRMSLAILLKRSEEHTSELQSPDHLVCRLLLEKKKNDKRIGHVLLLHGHHIDVPHRKVHECGRAPV